MIQYIRSCNLYYELTGCPCSGKSYYLQSKGISHINKSNLFNQIIFFFYGLYFLGVNKLFLFIRLSFQEKVPFLFSLNIIRNTILKFGIYYRFNNSKMDIYVDEGISHLFFNFLDSNKCELLEIIEDEIKNINIILIEQGDKSLIKNRLKVRGHSRLRFYNINDFIFSNKESESFIINVVSFKAKRLKIISNE